MIIYLFLRDKSIYYFLFYWLGRIFTWFLQWRMEASLSKILSWTTIYWFYMAKRRRYKLAILNSFPSCAYLFYRCESPTTEETRPKKDKQEEKKLLEGSRQLSSLLWRLREGLCIQPIVDRVVQRESQCAGFSTGTSIQQHILSRVLDLCVIFLYPRIC